MDLRSSTSAHNAEVHHTASHPKTVENVFQIITLYNADAFDSFLVEFDLTTKYPDLTFNLWHRFPIGDIPPLTCTYTPKNHKYAADQPDIIRTYCNEEVELG
jgi:hypothetical protein